MPKTHFEELQIPNSTLRPTVVPNIRYRNITKEVERAVAFANVAEGVVVIQTKHTTTAIIVNEYETGLIEGDLPRLLTKLISERTYEHDRAERILELGPDEPKNAPSHLRSILVGRGKCSATLVIHNSSIQLGTWQAVLFFDLDPDNHPGRQVVIQVMDRAQE